jgi:anti-sigma factor RsiW
MQKPGDELLIAYLDGELDEQRREEVEAWLDRDPALRERVALLGESAALIKAAFDEDLREPVPERLIAAARGESLSAKAGELGNVVAFRTKKALALHTRWWVTLPAAASLFGLVVGAGAGYWGVGAGDQRKPEPQVASTTSNSTGAWLDNIAGYHRLYTAASATNESAFDVTSKGDAGDVTTKIDARLPKALLPRVPDLKPWGLSFQGVRWLVVEGRPAAQLFYTTENKNIGPLTVVVATSKRTDLSPTFDHRDDVNMLYWRRGGRAYALVGQADKGWLWGLANDIGWQLNAI